MSYRGLAEELKTSLTSVQTRIKKLTDGGIIKRYQAILECSKLGYREMLMAHCRVNSNVLIEKVLQELEKIADIKMLYMTTGDYPIFIMAKCLSKEEQIALLERIRQTEGIEDIRTQIVMKKVKEDLRVKIPESIPTQNCAA
jgi:DNA-binding Lrp family transcriptional regulator